MSQSWDLFLDDNDNDTGSADTSSISMNQANNVDAPFEPKNQNNIPIEKKNQEQSNDLRLNSIPIPHPISELNSDDISKGNDNMTNSTKKDNPLYYPSQNPLDQNQQNDQFVNSNSSNVYPAFHKPYSQRPELPRYQTPPPTQKPQRILSDKDQSDGLYYYVQFHPNRFAYVKNPGNIDLEASDYVITEADRGIDLGRIVKIDAHPPEREITACRNIIRKASRQEIQMIPSKEEKEINAKKVCQDKANELGLPMQVTGTEFQFDGKKLTVYYTASQYIDFRNLVHTLFKVFGTRIWMVWFDGSSPVRDVFTHHTRDRRLTLD